MSKPGPKPGYKQSAEHVQKRKRFGPEHRNWKGDSVTTKGGRTRAIRKFPSIPKCACGKLAERHHKDGNTANNDKSNIAFVCRRCHMQEDGRLARFRKLARENQPKAVAARWN